MRIKSIVYSLFFCIFVGGLGLGGYAFFKDMEGPSITLTPNTGKISLNTEMQLLMSDSSKMRSVTVVVRKNNNRIPVFSQHFSPYQQEETVTFDLKKTGLREGAFDLEIRAVDASLAGFGFGNSRTIFIPMRLDTQKPRMSVISPQPYVRRGGASVVRYTINEEVQITGIKVGEKFFKGYKQADESYVCYFAFPHNIQPKDFKPVLMAQDLAGNTSERGVAVFARQRKFRSDRIKITDNFLDLVTERLYGLAPDAATPLERFLIINRDIRLANTTFLAEIGKESADTLYWKGSFMRLPRSASRAGYGDHRSYVYNDKVIDNQWHLGFDLASVKNAPVPSANNGKVVFTGELGIYGKLVVVDHGLGLMSLYSHLNDIFVDSGQMVKKGDELGTTGISGMAFGDHLHFGILVGGVEVTPLEWLDAKWIRDNITGRLENEL